MRDRSASRRRDRHVCDASARDRANDGLPSAWRPAGSGAAGANSTDPMNPLGLDQMHVTKSRTSPSRCCGRSPATSAEDQIDGRRVPCHEPGPPETLTDTERQAAARPGRPHPGRQTRLRATARARRLRSAVRRAARPARPGSPPAAVERSALPSVRARQGLTRTRGPRPAGRAAGARGLDQSPPPRAGSDCSTRIPCSCASAALGTRRRCCFPPSACIGSCGAAARAQTCLSGSDPARAARLLGHHSSKQACLCTPSRPGSGTSTCAPPPATPRRAARIDEIADVLDRRHHAARRVGRMV